MYAQITYFDGPRGPELVAAAERGGRDRVTPALLADAEVRADHVATFVLRRPDGGEVVVAITHSEETLHRIREIVLGTTLLPGEDPALLPGPDRVEMCHVIHAIEHGVITEDATR